MAVLSFCVRVRTKTKNTHIMNKEEATMDERLKNYALHKDNSIDRHMPKTSNKTFTLYCLLSPFIALTFWLWLIVLAVTDK
jgi:hypothetical protein